VRLELRGLPFAAANHHRGRPAGEPDLIIRANVIAPIMDVVFHFHGFSDRGAALRVADREPYTGLDWCNPDHPPESGRTRPTVGLMPRGHFVGGRSGAAYDFPAQTRGTAFQDMIDAALRSLASQRSLPAIVPRRLILTGHSGGGAPVTAMLARLVEHPPDEV